MAAKVETSQLRKIVVKSRKSDKLIDLGIFGKKHEVVTELTRQQAVELVRELQIAVIEVTDENCTICGEPWQNHYKHEARYKNGPFGTFDLKADHTPHIEGVHAPRKKRDGT